MGKIFYDLGVWFYSIAVRIAAPFNHKANKFINGRKGVFSTLKNNLNDNSKPLAWFHCASLGEFEQARPVLESFIKEYPSYFVLLTFFSPSGYEVRKAYPKADYITYLPIDNHANAKRFIGVTQPAIAFFVKYEFWYHYLHQLHQRKIPVISFSAIFRKNQIYFKSYGGFHAKILKLLSYILVQDQRSAQLLNSINIKHTSIGGDTRFDRVVSIVASKKKIDIAKKFKNGQTTLVIGSSWPPDIELIAEFYNNFSNPLKLIIAPHEITERNLVRTEEAFSGKKIIRYSKVNEQHLSEYDILIIDNVGMLTSLYQYGEFAYIGGAFGTGLHNTLEAATYGLPVFFGPKYDKFKEAVDLIRLKGAFSVSNSTAFNKIFLSLYQQEKNRLTTGNICKNYVQENTGGTQKVISLCKDYLS